MAIIALCSLNDAPGVTTLALGLSLTWHRPTMLIEADTSRSTSILAGYLRGSVPHEKSIINLAVATRGRDAISPDQIIGQKYELQEDRLLIPGLPDAVGASALSQVWGSLGSSAATFERANMDVFFDLGRLSVNDPRTSLLTMADATIIVARPTLPSFAAVQSRIGGILDGLAAHGVADNLRIVLAEFSDGPQLPSKEFGTAAGAPVLGRIPWDPKPAQVFSTGEAKPRGFEKSKYMRSLGAVQGSILTMITERRQKLAVPATYTQKEEAL